MGLPQSDLLSKLSLPAGFRFYPTDEELLVQYLCRKVAGYHFSLEIIREVDLYKHDPWVLPSMASFGEKEWYFFSPRDRKYPNGSRPNRVAGSGYWKATGTDKLITTEGRKVGIKKALVFYVGKAPKGTKTNWIMHEYRVIEPSRQKGSPKLDEWVLCRIYKKNSSAQKTASSGVASMEQYSNGGNSPTSSSSHEVIDSLPEIGNHGSLELPATTSFDAAALQRGDQQRPLNYLQSLGSDNLDWASLALLSSYPELAQAQTQSQSHSQSHSQSQTQPQQSQAMVNWNNCYGDSTANAPLGSELGCRGEGEGLSGLRTSQSLQNLMDGLSQNSNGLSPFGFPYPNFPGGFGFRQ